MKQKPKRIRRKLPRTLKTVPDGRVFKSQYDSKRFPTIAYSCCKHTGADNVTLGEIFNVGPYTIKNWMNANPEFRQWIQKGRDEYDTEVVERRLLDKALGFKYENKTYEREVIGWEYDDDGNKMAITEMVLTKIEEKQNAPDTTSLIFWLKNRNQERWRDVNRTHKTVEYPDGAPQITNNFNENHLTQVGQLILENATDEQLEMLEELASKNKPLLIGTENASSPATKH